MSARLVHFMLDETARACVEQCPQNRPDGVFDEELFEEMTIPENPPELPELPDGDYAIVIQADPMNDSSARITLVRLRDNDKPDTIATALIDLQPLMASAISTGEEYESAVEADLEILEQKILLERTLPLQGVFEPHIEGHNTAFNLQLLDVLDYIIYPAILGRMNNFNFEDAQEAGDHTITYRGPTLH